MRFVLEPGMVPLVAKFFDRPSRAHSEGSDFVKVVRQDALTKVNEKTPNGESQSIQDSVTWRRVTRMDPSHSLEGARARG